ncbi:MAG: SCO family protein [Methylotenera sp.]|uniref:SCO family protein n=1 Tax=Methylotenera sp. TaxID=2051956 RepID=UPI002489441A|nr:SCO family protein [Methylotenera sp.]MDI1310189.1 SCO family protein [Methylotenera sp.]
MRMLIVSFLFSFSTTVFAAPELPGDSVYQVGGTWFTENNESIQLESLAGKPQLIALIYTGCSNSCPVIVESMRRVEKQLPANMRNKIGFVLVSLTPDSDFPKTLKAFAGKKGLNSNWKVLRGNNDLVRALSNALNGRYKVIKEGDVAHSNTVTLLNNQGQIQVQASGTITGIKPILEVVEKEFAIYQNDSSR